MAVSTQLDDLYKLRTELNSLDETLQEQQFLAMTESEQAICEALGEQKAARYEALRLKIEAVEAEFAQKLEASLSDETKADINKIQKRTSKHAEALMTKITNLEADIKERVRTLGTTVRGTYLQCVFSRGKVSLIRDKFEAFAETNPAVLQCVKRGADSASIRPL